MAAAATEVDRPAGPGGGGHLGDAGEIRALRMHGAFDIGAGAGAELAGDVGVVAGFHSLLLSFARSLPEKYSVTRVSFILL